MNTPPNFLELLKSFVQINLLMQIMLIILAKVFAQGRTSSLWYFFFGVTFCVHAAFALFQIESPNVYARIFLGSGTLQKFDIDSVRIQSDFWKFIVPAISLGIGCSMIANFIGSNKAKE